MIELRFNNHETIDIGEHFVTIFYSFPFEDCTYTSNKIFINSDSTLGYWDISNKTFITLCNNYGEIDYEVHYNSHFFPVYAETVSGEKVSSNGYVTINGVYCNW